MLHVIINPVAGNGRANAIGAQVAETLEREGRLHGISRTEAIGHATELTKRAIRDGARTVVAVGGDGTVREVVLGLIGTDAALGIIPAGTGNDSSKMLGLPKKPSEALQHILANPAKGVDAGFVGDSLFFNVSGIGFDACVLDYANKAKKYVRGMLPYLWGVIRAIFTFYPADLTYRIDGAAPERRKLLIMAIANGNCFGGGLVIAPDAYPDDGLFDLVLVDSMPRHRLALSLPKLVSGRVKEIQGVRICRCKRVQVSGQNMRVNVDGELVSMAEAAFELKERALMAHW